MDHIDKLIIKACKSDNTDEHLERICKRYWLGDESPKVIMTYRMADIVDKHSLMNVSDILKNLIEKSNFEKFEDYMLGRQSQRVEIYDMLYECLITEIRFTEVSKFIEYRDSESGMMYTSSVYHI